MPPKGVGQPTFPIIRAWTHKESGEMLFNESMHQQAYQFTSRPQETGGLELQAGAVAQWLRV